MCIWGVGGSRLILCGFEIDSSDYNLAHTAPCNNNNRRSTGKSALDKYLSLFFINAEESITASSVGINNWLWSGQGGSEWRGDCGWSIGIIIIDYLFMVSGYMATRGHEWQRDRLDTMWVNMVTSSIGDVGIIVWMEWRRELFILILFRVIAVNDRTSIDQ